MADIAAIRRRVIAAHEADLSAPAWPDVATIEAARWRPSSVEEWAGRARMAHARRAAGVELDELDRQALARVEQGAA